MYEIYFYRDKNGKEPVKEYIAGLAAKKDKDSRVKLNKIMDYVKTLSVYGTRAGEPYIKHIDGNIWELSPLANIIFFFYWKDNKFVMVHYYVKKSQKMPKRELEQARRNIKDYIESEGG